MVDEMPFLMEKEDNFLAWICPNFKPRVCTAHETVYCENDELSEVYFCDIGECNYVLPKFRNANFL
jgi:hypothetical protein